MDHEGAGAAHAAPLDLDRDQLILDNLNKVERLATNFWRANKYPIEVEEMCAEANVALVWAARAYDPRTTLLPFGAYACQHVLWRLHDFIQRWYRLGRVDYTQGKPDQRRQVPLDPDDEALVDRRMAYPGEMLDAQAASRAVRQVLSDREQRMLQMRFTDGRHLKDIAAALGLTHNYTRKVYVRVIRRLRDALGVDDPAAA